MDTNDKARICLLKLLTIASKYNKASYKDKYRMFDLSGYGGKLDYFHRIRICFRYRSKMFFQLFINRVFKDYSDEFLNKYHKADGSGESWYLVSFVVKLSHKNAEAIFMNKMTNYIQYNEEAILKNVIEFVSRIDPEKEIGLEVWLPLSAIAMQHPEYISGGYNMIEEYTWYTFDKEKGTSADERIKGERCVEIFTDLFEEYCNEHFKHSKYAV